jgi:hypothetical protein
MVTCRPPFTASLRARLSAVTKSFAWLMVLFRLIVSMKLGTPIARMMDATRRVTINSTRVNPVIFFIMITCLAHESLVLPVK